MSLLRLLSSGKSLIGGATDDTVRYRMGRPGMLPKFGASTKPAEAPVKRATPVTHQVVTEPQTKAAPPEPEQPAVSTKKSFSLRAAYQSFLDSIKARLSRIYVKPSRPTTPRSARLHLQAELSLDKVRVVRNDLSESDLEVVPKRSGAGIPIARGGRAKNVEGVSETSSNATPSSPARRVEAASTQS